jgi:hypothetical protein
MAIVTSKQYSLNTRDLLKGLLVAVITPVITVITSSLNAGSLTFDWKVIGATALAAGLAYLVKNFFTPAQTVLTATDTIDTGPGSIPPGPPSPTNPPGA